MTFFGPRIDFLSTNNTLFVSVLTFNIENVIIKCLGSKLPPHTVGGITCTVTVKPILGDG